MPLHIHQSGFQTEGLTYRSLDLPALFHYSSKVLGTYTNYIFAGFKLSHIKVLHFSVS